MDIRIVSKKPKIQNSVIILGFPGVGLVGSIASKYLTQKLNAKQIGYIESPHLPPLCFIQEGDIYNPIRIYEVPKKGLIIISSEFPVPANLIHDLGEAIAKWSKDAKASKIICLEGINSPEMAGEPEVYAIDADIKAKLPAGLKPLRTGYILGVSASVMLNCKAKNMNALCIMAESHTGYPDGLAAAALIKKLNKISSINVDTAPLTNEAKEFEDKIKELIVKARKFKEGDDRKDDIMYG